MRTIACLCVVCAIVSGVFAGEPAAPENRDDWPADTRARIGHMSHAPEIDGVIHDDEWAEATELASQVSQSGEHCFYPRQVIWYLGWDADALYLGSRTVLLENERPKRNARANVGCEVMMDDTIECWFDPKGRNQGKELASYFQTIVSPLAITYFCRLYPTVAARTEDWRPKWKIASKIHDGVLDFEIAMPAREFALEKPNQAGDTWGMMLARNFMYNCWNQSPLAYNMPGFGFSVNTRYPLMTLADNLPVVKFRPPLGLFSGKASAEATVTNPGKRDCKVKATVVIQRRERLKAAKNGAIFEFHPLYSSEKEIAVAAASKQTFSLSEATTPPLNPEEKAVYRYLCTFTAEDGTELYHTHFLFNPTENREWLTHMFPAPKDLKAWVSFNPVRRLVDWNVDVLDFPRKAEAKSAKLVVSDAQGQTICEAKTSIQQLDLFRAVVDLPEMKPGRYPWKASLILADGSEVPAGEGTAEKGAIEKKDEAAGFPWWNAKLGDAEKVLWPYQPVALDNNTTLKAWGKELALNGLALPAQIRSTGNADKWPAGRTGAPEVLAAPIALRATIAGQEAAFGSSAAPVVVSRADHRIVLTGSAEAADVRATTKTAWEQDGAYFIELTLAPTRDGVVVDRLDLSIPVRQEVATFLNAYAHCGFSGYFIAALPTEALGAGNSPERTRVWDPSLCGQPTVTQGDFIPQIWLGNEFRGLLWYADNDQGWTPADGRPAQEIFREPGRATLVMHLFREPVTLRGLRTLRFVLQPTPIRPLVPGWRCLNVDFSQSFLNWDQMGRSNAGYSAMINLNNAASYAKSKTFAASWKGPKSEAPNLAMYYAPHTESSAIMTSVWTDRGYFGGEWQDGTYNPTLNDHTLFHVAKWIDDGGLQGLYHDQFSPNKITNPSSGLAYLLPDGRVQPGFALSTRRSYVMREHALFMEKGFTPPRILTHATNGAPLGSCGWVSSCMDGEDKQIERSMGSDWADTWTSERIRAGSISYNMGATFAWMRLINEAPMTKEERAHHARVFAGHCLMHDVMNAWFVVNNGWRGKSALLQWGMNDERVLFWPHWNNADAVSGGTNDVKVSAWTLPDRLLLCVFNYQRTEKREAALSVDLGKLGITLPEGASAWNLEKPDEAFALEVAGGTAVVKVAVVPRDYVLVSVGAKAK